MGLGKTQPTQKMLHQSKFRHSLGHPVAVGDGFAGLEVELTITTGGAVLALDGTMIPVGVLLP